MSPRLRVIYLPLQAKQRFFTNGKQNRIEQAVKPGVPQQLPVQLLSVAQRQQPPLPQPNLPASALPSLQPQELSPLLKTENEENALSNRGNNNKSNLNQQQVLLSSRKQPYQVCVHWSNMPNYLRNPGVLMRGDSLPLSSGTSRC